VEIKRVSARDVRLYFIGLFLVLAVLAGIIETSKWLAGRRKKIGPPTVVDVLLAFFGIVSGRIRRK
jgi:hypothetical protein